MTGWKNGSAAAAVLGPATGRRRKDFRAGFRIGFQNDPGFHRYWIPGNGPRLPGRGRSKKQASSLIDFF